MIKRVCTATILLFVLSFSVILLGDESSTTYFPDSLDSYWIYEDQNENEFTRRAVEGEEIGDEVLSAFSYEPELENWQEYSCFLTPSLYKVNDDGIVLVVGDEVEKALKARLQNEMDVVREIIMSEAPPDAVIEIEIDVQSQDQLLFLPDNVTENEEWDVNEYDAKITMSFSGGGLAPSESLVVAFQILETGIVLGKETLNISAGTFEDCIKVEFRTETTLALTPPPPPEDVEQPGETVTTVWLAPNVGIVKFHQEWNFKFLDIVPDDNELPKPPDPIPITFELKEYEIKTDGDNSEKSE